ncbi:MAG: serine hydrolase [Phormidium sp.]
MAAFDKSPKRRQRRQQTKQQQAPQRQQQLAKTPSKRSGSSGARQMQESQSPRELRPNQPRQRSTPAKSGNWWEKLFGQKTKPPARRVPKGRANLEAVTTPANYRQVTELRPRNNDNLNQWRERNLEIVKPVGRQPPVSRNGRYEFRENGYKSTPRTISSPNRSKPPAQKEFLSPLVYGTRLLILGIGLGVFVGTLLSILDPATRQPSGATSTIQTSPTTSAVTIPAAPEVRESPVPSTTTTFNLTQEIAPLKTQIAAVSSENSLFTPGVFVIDLESGSYVDVNGNNVIAVASTIKVPILIAFLQDVEAGKIQWDEKLTLKPEFRASGSGNMQHRKPGTEFTAEDVVKRMITISDNTATNMVIDRLGGMEALNRRFQEWGLTTTALRNPLPDTKGTNTSSPRELAVVMARVMRGELLSAEKRDRMIDIMQQTENNNLLPKGIGEGAKIAHKTGNIGSMLADVGMVYLPSGKQYIIAVMVQRPRRDVRAQKIIQQISSTTYQYFNQSPQTPSTDTQVPDPNQPSIQPQTPLPTTANWRSSLKTQESGAKRLN